MSKADLFKEAQASNLVAEGTTADDYTVVALKALLGRGAPAGEGGPSGDDPDFEPLTQPAPKEPIVAADGHENLTQADIDARQ